MRTLSVATALFAACTAAHNAAYNWEITFYENKNCDKKWDVTEYYVYSGQSHYNNPSCIQIGDEPPENVYCEYYTHGGKHGPFKCKGYGFNLAGSYYISQGDFILNKGTQSCYSGVTNGNKHGCQNVEVGAFTPK